MLDRCQQASETLCSRPPPDLKDGAPHPSSRRNDTATTQYKGGCPEGHAGVRNGESALAGRASKQPRRTVTSLDDGQDGGAGVRAAGGRERCAA
eukprot:50249-Eustigmatos_ZCMA.PRE.1